MGAGAHSPHPTSVSDSLERVQRRETHIITPLGKMSISLFEHSHEETEKFHDGGGKSQRNYVS